MQIGCMSVCTVWFEYVSFTHDRNKYIVYALWFILNCRLMKPNILFTTSVLKIYHYHISILAINKELLFLNFVQTRAAWASASLYNYWIMEVELRRCINFNFQRLPAKKVLHVDFIFLCQICWQILKLFTNLIDRHLYMYCTEL